MTGVDLTGYVEVAERIVAFYEKYPEGSLKCGGWEVREVGEQTFIVYHALAYRSRVDARPADGYAWEPYPGKTSFTRDSELMNAETSAWGRALAALGFEVKRGIATKEDVQKAQPTNNNASATTPASPKQKGAIKKLLKASALSEEAQKVIWVWGHTAPDGKGGKTLSRPRAAEIFDAEKEPHGLQALAERAGFSDLPPPDDVPEAVPDESVPGDEKVAF